MGKFDVVGHEDMTELTDIIVKFHKSVVRLQSHIVQKIRMTVIVAARLIIHVLCYRITGIRIASHGVQVRCCAGSGAAPQKVADAFNIAYHQTHNNEE